MKINEMGTTGLIEYIKEQPTARTKALALGRVCQIYQRRGIETSFSFRRRLKLASGMLELIKAGTR